MALISSKLSLTRIREKLRSSLWFLPGLAALSALVAVRTLAAVDRRLDATDAWWLFPGQSDSARELLSTIASSVMTFTALVFSITILVLQLASGQFSPRVLTTFLSDRMSQGAMATFVGALVYALALLPEVRSEDDGDPAFVPRLSLFVAFVLVLACIGVFIAFINHMAHAVRAVTIIKRVSAETQRVLCSMYPEGIASESEPESAAFDDPPDAVLYNEQHGGVVSAVDDALLLDVAKRTDAVIALVPEPGDFVPAGAPLFRLWGAQQLGKDDREALREAVLLQSERTTHQDPLFGVRQLVDIAERALSPGINDPSTAVQVLDELHTLLRMLVTRRFPSPRRADDHGRLRLVLPRASFAAYVRLALDEIRQYGSSSTQVMRRMRLLIDDCLSIAPTPARRAVFEEQLRLLDAAVARSFETARERDVARAPSPQGHGEIVHH